MPATTVNGTRNPGMWRPKISAHGPLATEPVLRTVNSRWRDVKKSGQTVFDQTPAKAARQQVKVRRAQGDRKDEAQPRGAQNRNVVRQAAADIEEEDIPRDEQGDAGFLDVDERKPAEIAERLQQRADGGVGVDDLSRHVVLDEGPDSHDHSDQKHDASRYVPVRREAPARCRRFDVAQDRK